MNHNGDNSPSMDYYELRRRHEQFKKRHAINEASEAKARPAQNHSVKPAEAPVQPSAEKVLRDAKPEQPVEDVLPQAASAAPEEVVLEPEAAPIEAPAEDDVIDIPLEEEPIDDYADEDDDFDEDEENNGNPNPFESFISLFHGVQNRIRRGHNASDEDEEAEFDEDDFQSAPKRRLFGRKKDKDDDYVDFDDSDYAEEDYIAEEFPNDAPSAEAEPSPEPASVEAEPVAEEAPAANVEDIEDVEEDFTAPVRRTARRAAAEAFDEADEEPDEDLDEDDDDWDDEDFDEDEAPGNSALKRFVSLFVVRDDEEDLDDEDDEENDGFDSASDDAEEDFSDQFVRRVQTAALRKDPSAASEHRTGNGAEIEGGPDMDEKNKLNLEMTEQMAAGLETCGMSRRERRELAERQAAAEAAKRAAEEAARLSFEEEPLVADSVKDVSRGIAEVDSAPINLDALNAIPAQKPAIEEETSDADLVDEPTREFKPLSKRASKSAAKADPLFSFDAADEDEDEDDDEEEEEKPSRFSFFRGKKNAAEEEDDEDEDDEDDEDEDDDEDDEPVRKKSRRNRRAKKSRSARYDEDEDEDEDEDDYDEYDEYDDDEDEDDYDDYDDDYDDDEGEGFGRTVLGFLKGLVGIVLFLLIIVFALNALDFFNVVSLDSLFENYYNKAPGVFDTLFPGHEFKLRMNTPTDSLSAIDPLENATVTADPYAAATATVLPSVTEAPAVTEAPVVTEAPAATDDPSAAAIPAVTEAPAGTVG